MKKNETMKATELIKKLIGLVGEHADCDIIIDYDCRRIKDVIFDESGDEDLTEGGENQGGNQGGELEG